MAEKYPTPAPASIKIPEGERYLLRLSSISMSHRLKHMDLRQRFLAGCVSITCSPILIWVLSFGQGMRKRKTLLKSFLRKIIGLSKNTLAA
jgi:hypothetical protein